MTPQQCNQSFVFLQAGQAVWKIPKDVYIVCVLCIILSMQCGNMSMYFGQVVEEMVHDVGDFWKNPVTNHGLSEENINTKHEVHNRDHECTKWATGSYRFELTQKL